MGRRRSERERSTSHSGSTSATRSDSGAGAGAGVGEGADAGADVRLGGASRGRTSAFVQVPFSRWYFNPFGFRYDCMRAHELVSTTKSRLFEDAGALTFVHPGCCGWGRSGVSIQVPNHNMQTRRQNSRAADRGVRITSRDGTCCEHQRASQGSTLPRDWRQGGGSVDPRRREGALERRALHPASLSRARASR